MSNYNFNNKTFLLLENSEEGKVTSDTVFEYKQDGNVVTANYHGGTIKYGKIIALLNGDTLDMLYQCITNEDELKAGKAIAAISLSQSGKIKLQLNWEWLGDNQGSGLSEYIEQ